MSSVNIHAVNADGARDLGLIGTALKNAKAVIEEQTEFSTEELNIDEAIAIMDRIFDEGSATG